MLRSINWFPWCNNTFDRASHQKKPILMYLTAPWCAWCNVMEETTYQDPQVIKIIENYFIPMKVNVDQYPHVADRYHYGGYPSVLFLSGSGHILKGENYLPGEQMKAVLEEVIFDLNQGKAAAEPMTKGKKPVSDKDKKGPKKIDHYPVPLLQISHAAKIIEEAFDNKYGGFFVNPGDPKFPLPEINDFLMAYTEWNVSPQAEMMLTRTLDAMCSGDIYDRVKGGFFRLCEGRDWTLPHSEKLLESNAGLLGNYLAAFHRYGVEKYRMVAQDTIRYLMDNLFDRESFTFGGSQIGNEIDHTPYTNWNSIMVSSLILAYQILGEKTYLETALGVIESLWDRCYRLGRGMSHFFLGVPSEVELFSDQVKFLTALCNAYNCTKQTEYIQRVQLLLKHINKNYRSLEGNFFDIPLTALGPGYLNIPLVPFVDNFEMSMVYVKIARALGQRVYAQKSDKLLKGLSVSVKSNPIFAAKYGQGLLDLENYRMKNRKYS